MSDDVRPMAPCPVEKHGRHELAAVIPADEAGDLTLFCERCGALRRVPVSGLMSHLDDADVTLLLRGLER